MIQHQDLDRIFPRFQPDTQLVAKSLFERGPRIRRRIRAGGRGALNLGHPLEKKIDIPGESRAIDQGASRPCRVAQ